MAANINIACWNVRGLNSQARKATVHEILAATNIHLACLQETKLRNVDQATAAYPGNYRLQKFAFSPATGPLGTRGGILLLWDDLHVDLSDVSTTRHTISATVRLKECGTEFIITTVYGLSKDLFKPAFLNELKELKPEAQRRWLVLGDFNLIYRAWDKNNRNLN